MKKVFLLLAVLTLSACGFHLRGVGGQALNIQSLYLVNNGANSGASALSFNALQETLKNNGVTLLNHAEENIYKVVISDYSTSRRQIASGGDHGDTREIELTDGYHVALFKGEEAIADIVISNNMNVAYTADQYIGSQEEEKLAHKHIANENANATIRFIQSQTQ